MQTSERPGPCFFLTNEDDLPQFPSVAAARSAVEPELFDAREYLRRPEFDNAGAEGYVLWMCRDYVLVLVLARGGELLNEGYRGFALCEEMRAFTTAELARLERIHWSPARDEFGGHPWTNVEFQLRFESMIRMESESKVLPVLGRASYGVGGPADVRPAAVEEIVVGTSEPTFAGPLVAEAVETQRAEPEPADGTESSGDERSHPDLGPSGNRANRGGENQCATTRQTFVQPILTAKGWSLLDWANNSTVDFHTVNDYLKGTTKPYASTRKKLADSLGAAATDLPA